MNTDAMIKMIDAYFAGKTSPEEERLLFSSLSLDAQGREYFKDSLLFKTALQSAEEQFPVHLDDKILGEVERLRKREFLREYTSPKFLPLYAVTICILIFSFVFFNKMESYKSEMDKALIMVKDQQNTIELLMNGLPTVQVHPASEKTYNLLND